LRSKDPIIRQNAIDELDGLGHVLAWPKIRELLTDSDENVRLAAATAVKNLEE
jgi:HEAT repeat protein